MRKDSPVPGSVTLDALDCSDPMPRRGESVEEKMWSSYVTNVTWRSSFPEQRRRFNSQLALEHDAMGPSYSRGGGARAKRCGITAQRGCSLRARRNELGRRGPNAAECPGPSAHRLVQASQRELVRPRPAVGERLLLAAAFATGR
jgi:hypothetical protein